MEKKTRNYMRDLLEETLVAQNATDIIVAQAQSKAACEPYPKNIAPHPRPPKEAILAKRQLASRF